MSRGESIPNVGERFLAQTEFAYTAPYEWGNFSVTQIAHEAYGLQPFTSDVEAGEGPSPKRLEPGSPEVWVVLAGPGELTETNDEEEPDILVHVLGGSEQVAVIVASSHSRSRLIERMTGEIATFAAGMLGVGENMTPEDHKELLSHIRYADGEPVAESIEQQYAIGFVDGLKGVVYGSLNDNLKRWYSLHRQREVRRGATKSIVYANFLGAAAAANVVSFGNTQAWPFALGAMGLISMGGSIGTLRAALRIPIEKQATMRAQAVASLVSRDIHNDFCPRAFNRRMERSMFDKE